MLRGHRRRASDDVDLGRVQGELCPQIQPGQQAQDNGEEAVHLAGMLEVVADQIATGGQQQLPGDPAHDRADHQQPGGDLAGG